MTRHSGSICVLHVDDEPGFADMAAEFLERADDRFSVTTVTSASDGLTHLADERVDCILSDYDMPGMDGIEFLRAVREDHPDLPFVLFTGKGSEDVASDALTNGATDYLQKESGTQQYELLANRVHNAVDQYRSQRRAANLERVRRLVNDVNQALVRASSRTEIESRVCDIISDADPYRFVAFAGVDEEAHQVEVSTWAGVGGDVLDDIDLTIPEDAGDGRSVLGQVYHERELVVSQNIREDPQYDSIQDLAMEYGFHALAVVPLGHEDTLYGLVGMFTNRPDAFDDTEQELLAELGDDIAHALHAQEVTEQLRRSKNRFQALFENAPGPVIAGEIRDGGDGHLVRDVNDAFEDKFGYDAEDIRGRDVAEVVVPATGQDRHTEFRERAAAGDPVEARVERETDDGSREFLLQIIPFGTADDVADGWYAWYTDISARREREQVIEELHSTADTLMEAESVERVCERTIEASQDILAFDLSVIDLEEAGVLTKTAVSEDISPENLADMPVDEGLAGKTYRTGESYLVDDVERSEAANPQGPYRSGVSVPIGAHGVFQAVSESPGAFDESDLELAELLVSHAESALDRLASQRQLERHNERLEEFASAVSHDLQNPLSVAQGRLDLAREECDSEHLDDAAAAVDRSLTLIEDLLALAREGEQVSDREMVDLAETFEGCWSTVETADAELVVESEQRIRADPGRLKQLFENLIRNAVEHGGDDVTVTMGELGDGFYVADDGRGIPESDREQVFEAGYSGTNEGTGFGLNIVTEIVDAHDWTIRATESEAGGARFEITGVTDPDS